MSLKFNCVMQNTTTIENALKVILNLRQSKLQFVGSFFKYIVPRDLPAVFYILGLKEHKLRQGNPITEHLINDDKLFRKYSRFSYFNCLIFEPINLGKTGCQKWIPWKPKEVIIES
ncbi:hypothetical protein ACOME3_000866 [Neoechinorhynchus agilis]